MQIDFKVRNGKLLRIKAGISDNRIQVIRINGDFFLHPEESIADLEQCLIGAELREEDIVARLYNTVRAKGIEMVGISPEDIATAIVKGEQK